VLACAASLGLGFAWDDHRIIESSPRMHALSTAAEVFVRPSCWVIGDAAETPVTTYRPLVLASMAVDWALFDGHPAGFHATSLALHLACVGALLWLLLRLGVSAPVALVGAAVFGVHPTGAEAVTWINGRSEPLCLLFGLLALGLAAGPEPLTPRRAIGVAATLLLSLLGKETGLIFAVLAGLVLFTNARAPGLPWRPARGLGAIVAGVGQCDASEAAFAAADCRAVAGVVAAEVVEACRLDARRTPR
jgi:hypothetical protein